MKTNHLRTTDDELALTSTLALPGALPINSRLAAESPGAWQTKSRSALLRPWQLLGWTASASLCFHAAYATTTPFAAFLVILYVFCLVQLARAPSWRRAFYSGLTVGLLIAAPRLTFFWAIFSGGAVALWLVFAVWVGFFTAAARLAFLRLPGWLALIAIPILWTGFEYFRSELYYLRFSWLSPGYGFGLDPGLAPLNLLGVYGTGFVCAAIAGVSVSWWSRSRLKSAAGLLAGMAMLFFLGKIALTGPTSPPSTLAVAGVQLEFPTENEVLFRLNELVRKHPAAELLVLPEYSFSETVPAKIKEWCRRNSRYLVACGKDPAPGGQFYNTAWVIDPRGEIVFRQVKAVPIQFFKDGLGATSQAIWESPWGKLGICICYDLSYTRITDQLVRQGARCLIVPTMDVADWGKAQHELHARVAPVRAREYGLPVFRVASSGISQAIDATGKELASAPFPGDGRILGAQLALPENGHLPLDRWLAPSCVGFTAALTAWFCLVAASRRRTSIGFVFGGREAPLKKLRL